MLSEFAFLKHLKDHFNLPRVGDDCAVFPKDEQYDYLITSDLLVENVDFRHKWSTPEFVGHKALAVSVSDISAMGGSPTFSMLSIGAPQTLWDTDYLDRFYGGYMRLAGRLGVELIGGDVSRTDGHLSIDSTVIGTCAKNSAVMRSGASVGDLIFVTGTVGGAAAGLHLLETGTRYGTHLDLWKTSLLNQQLRPNPVEGSFLSEVATSAIDISDGLAADLGHLCEASEAGARLYRERIPVDANISGLGLNTDQVFDLVLHGGEDFQILFTVSPEKFSGFHSFPFKPIGEMTEDAGNIELIIDGVASPCEPKGFTHF
jgi:thiamine-monophosphate kinase